MLFVSQSPKNRETLHLLTIDFHSGPITCNLPIFKELDIIVHAEIDYPHCAHSGVCLKNLKVVSRGMNGIPESGYGLDPCPQRARRLFYEAYNNDKTFSNIDVIYCSHPAANCELFMPFQKKLIIQNAQRIEFGRFDDGIGWRKQFLTNNSFNRWLEWFQNIKEISLISGNYVLANNLYDVHHMQMFANVSAQYIPSWCGDSGASYSVKSKDYLIGPYRNNIPPNHEIFLGLINMTKKSGFSLRFVRDVYPDGYSLKDLASHPALIFIPYTVSVISFIEYYRLNLPIFVPSQKLLLDWDNSFGICAERIYGHPPTVSNMLPNPNIPKNLKYWIHFLDYYVFPHVQYFDDMDDLVDKLKSVNLSEVSSNMKIYNNLERKHILFSWKSIFDGIRKQSKHRRSAMYTQPSTIAQDDPSCNNSHNVYQMSPNFSFLRPRLLDTAEQPYHLQRHAVGHDAGEG